MHVPKYLFSPYCAPPFLPHSTPRPCKEQVWTGTSGPLFIQQPWTTARCEVHSLQCLSCCLSTPSSPPPPTLLSRSSTSPYFRFERAWGVVQAQPPPSCIVTRIPTRPHSLAIPNALKSSPPPSTSVSGTDPSLDPSSRQIPLPAQRLPCPHSELLRSLCGLGWIDLPFRFDLRARTHQDLSTLP